MIDCCWWLVDWMMNVGWFINWLNWYEIGLGCQLIGLMASNGFKSIYQSINLSHNLSYISYISYQYLNNQQSTHKLYDIWNNLIAEERAKICDSCCSTILDTMQRCEEDGLVWDFNLFRIFSFVVLVDMSILYFIDYFIFFDLIFRYVNMIFYWFHLLWSYF